MTTPVTLYFANRRTSYTPPNMLVVEILGNEGRQSKIANSIALVFEKFCADVTPGLPGEQLEYLQEKYNTTPSAIITFALTFAAGAGGVPAFNIFTYWDDN
jgi:hypothetical protein